LTSQRKELIKKEKEKELIKIELIKKELKENKAEDEDRLLSIFWDKRK
jgi:hypothetical protein